MFFNFNKRKGFTLAELLVVISIIGILSSITLVNLKGVREKVRDANRISDMKQIIVAIELYRDKNGDLPGRIENCEVEGGVRLGERGSCVDHELFEFINVPADPLLDAQNYYYAYDPISCNDNVCDGRGGAVIGFNQSESGIQDREASCGAEENLDNAAWNRIICYGNNRGSGCETCSSLEVECGTDLDDGCGGTINCFCPNGETCDNGTCVSDCTPETCSSLEVECGTDLDDGCGGTINCSCPNGETCDNGVCVYETCGDVTFTYNGSQVTYGTVVYDGECWMDRNLGASREAQSYDDSEAYGDLFQWGRPDDGHQERSSGETSTLASADHPGHSDFIKSGSSPSDWRDPQNDNMWNTDGSGSNDGESCPEGWRVPSETEWSSVSSNWSDRSDAFDSVLKLPCGGYRNFSDGSIHIAGSYGYYWSSSVDGTDARNLNFYSDDVYFNSYNRANGQSVRCLRDSGYSSSPTSLNTDYIKIKTNINVNSGTRASTTWSGLNNDTTYSWYVVADDGSATTSSDTWSFETNKTPDSPSNLKQYKSDCVTEINGGDWINETEICLKGQITDSDSGDQVKLQVDYATSSDSFDNIVDVASTEWCSATCTATTSLSGLNSGTQYKWQARSIDDQGASSSFVQFNGDSAFRVDTVSPSGGSISYIDGYSTSSSIEIDLSDGTDSTSGISTSSRLLQRKEANLNGGSCGSFNSFSNLASGSDITYSTHTDSALSNDTCYQYRYLVEDEAGNNATYTSSNILKVDTEPPANLRNLSIVKIEKNSISLDWEKAADNQFDYYEIWYGENQTDVENRQNTASEWSVTEDPDLTSVTTINTKISGLTAETGYYFKLWVVDKAGLENSSGPIFQTTAASGPKEIFRGEGIKLDGFNFGL